MRLINFMSALSHTPFLIDAAKIFEIAFLIFKQLQIQL